MGQHRNLSQEVGGYDVESVLRVVLGTRLIPEDPERQHHDPDRTVSLGNPAEKLGVSVHRVRVELDGVDGVRARLPHSSLLGIEVGAAPSGQYDGSPRRESGSDLESDLAATAQQQQRSGRGFSSSAHADQSCR